MRHRKKKITLSRTPAERSLLARKMTLSLLQHGALQTTATRAKFLRRFVEPLITKGKVDTLATRRYLISRLGNVQAVGQVLEKGKLYAARSGGYTRVTKLSKRRAGDASPLVYIEFV